MVDGGDVGADGDRSRGRSRFRHDVSEEVENANPPPCEASQSEQRKTRRRDLVQHDADYVCQKRCFEGDAAEPSEQTARAAREAVAEVQEGETHETERKASKLIRGGRSRQEGAAAMRNPPSGPGTEPKNGGGDAEHVSSTSLTEVHPEEGGEEHGGIKGRGREPE